MLQRLSRFQLPIFIIAATLAIGGLTAWQEKQNPPSVKHTATDTIPKKENRKAKNIDDALNDLDKAQAELELKLKNLHIELKEPLPPIPPIEVDKIEIEIEQAIKEIDVEKMKVEVAKALKEIDAVKLKEEVSKAMKDIDPEKIKASVAEALKSIDAAKIKASVDASLASVNMEELKAEMKMLKEIEMPRIQAELKNIKPEVEKALAGAKVEIEKARAEMKAYKAFEEDLEKDGLINKKEDYKIEHKDEQLLINGKAQPDAVYNKYRPFLEKHKKLVIEKNKDDYNIHKD